MDFKYIEKLLPDQAHITTSFMDSLANEDLELFWDCLSKADKGYVIGTFNMMKELESPDLELDDWVRECLNSKKNFFSEYINNYGVSTSVRHNNKLIANVFLPKNIETNIVILKEVEAAVMVLPLILEFNLNEKEEIVANWKVYLFANDQIEAPL
jgi:hypothetical protein